jgi:Icc-related predicted phosphoesterase
LDLYNKVLNIKPKLHIFGHIHEGYGIKEQDGITFINASTCTLGYNPTNKPIQISLS